MADPNGMWQIGTVLERNEHVSNAFEELCARYRHDSEVEEDAEEHRKRDHAEVVLGEQAQSDRQVYKQIG